MKWSFDLAEELALALRVVERGIEGHGEVCILPESSLTDESVVRRRSLVELSRSEKLIEDETGLHDFYVGFPFLKGHLDPEHYVRAPIVLLPARLEHRKTGRPAGWYLVFAEDEPPVWNQVLLAAARIVTGIQTNRSIIDRLDDLVERLQLEKDNATRLFAEGVQQVLRDEDFPLQTGPVPVDSLSRLEPMAAEDVEKVGRQPLQLSTEIVYGYFPQASSAVYHDYEEMIDRATKGETEQGVVSDLLEAPSEIPSSDSGSEGPQSGRMGDMPDRKLNFVLPSDGSQDAVVIESQTAPCVVVRGPPGTGKSQVIVNLISNALWQGQKVLLICQKRAALDVVFQRLDRVGLSDYVEVLHDERVDRSQVYKRLNRVFSKGYSPQHYASDYQSVEELSQEIDKTTLHLNAIVEPLWREYYGGVRPAELYLLLDHGFKPRMEIGALEAQIDYPNLKSLVRKLGPVERSSKRFDSTTYPLSKRAGFSTLGQADRLDFQKRLEESLQSSRQDYSILGSTVNETETIRDLESFLRLSKSSLRWLHSSWWTQGRKGERFLRSRRELPKTETAKQWITKLQNGRQLLASIEKLKTYLSPVGHEEIRGLVQEPVMLQDRLQSMSKCLVDFDDIQEHDSRLSSLGSVEKGIVDLCLKQIPDVDDWGNAISQEFYFRWIDAIEKANPSLKGKPFESYLELRNNLETLLEKKSTTLSLALRKKLEYDSLTPVLPPDSDHGNRRAETEWNKLAHEFGKRRRLLPLRKLYEQYYFQMNRIVSCWLMSPECVSEVFPLKRGMFDLIIFDEASQLAVERSFPAIYRAKRVVVAGDEKQLRPFDLFQIKEGEEDDAEEVPEATTVESLLMLAKRIFSFRYLNWHYRSKYQELIDFSNHAFYDGQLQVAGSVTRNAASPPIRWVPCKGTWNDRRQNMEEALRVVEVLKQVLSRGESEARMPSIGVVTFNEPQRGAILDEIDISASKDPDFDRLLDIARNPKSGNIDDRLFVKNIENVQGDERDVIVFSVGYAEDTTGRLRLHFGSLSVEGGENRLNVAVTRAREQVVVVCSFNPLDMQADRVQNQGPKFLRKYLDYSEAISNGKEEAVKSILTDLDSTMVKENAPTAVVFETDLERQVYDGLTKMGFQVETQYGYSGYRIDLVVKDPKDPTRYALAVECDGAAFHSARSARERDVFRQKFLEGRGWKVERIWSRNWWRNPEGELQRIRSAIEKNSS